MANSLERRMERLRAKQVDESKRQPVGSRQSRRVKRRRVDRESPAEAASSATDLPKVRVARLPGPPDGSAINIEKRFGISPARVSAVIERENGLMTGVSKALKIPYSTLTRYVRQRPECMEAATTAREKMGDVAEKKLFELIKAGDVRCLLYYLSTVHRNRGYGLRPGESPFNAETNRPVHVETINIVAIPPGQFIPKPEPQTIEN